MQEVSQKKAPTSQEKAQELIERYRALAQDAAERGFSCSDSEDLAYATLHMCDEMEMFVRQRLEYEEKRRELTEALIVALGEIDQ